MSEAKEDPTFEYVVYFTAPNEAEADNLVDRMLDGLGCTDDPDHECPHFRLGLGPWEVAGNRRAALRQCRKALADSARVISKGRVW